MKKPWMMVSALVSVLSLAAPAAAAPPEASAEDSAGNASVDNRGVITLPATDIAGRLDRPQAAMAISRISTQLTLVDLKQIFLERIEQTIMSGPF